MRAGCFILIIFILSLFGNVALAELETSEVTYSAGETTLKGYLAYDGTNKGKRPGVIVVHEWWGHNDYARSRAEQLAKLGYTALALDMYGDGKRAEHPEDAKAFSSAVVPELERERFNAALKVLREHETVDSGKIAAIGYCFGGKIVLNMARAGSDLAGVVSFHGSLGTGIPAEKGKVKAKVLAYNGADDPFIPAETIVDFKKEMDSAGVDYKFINLPGAKHSFTNPGSTAVGKKYELPLEYNEKADLASWSGMKEFFKEIFRR